MASAGTLLSDLDQKSPVFSNKDDDLVNKILSDMNLPSATNPTMNSMNPMSGGNRMIYAPNPNSTYPVASDPSTATAHIIGKDFPTPADFANMMQPTSPYAHSPYQASAPQLSVLTPSFYTEIWLQMKQPLLVAIIIFLVGLPFLNVLIGHYLPSLMRIGGDLTTAGLVLKSLFGGFLFWFIQKVFVPLMMI
jgi:hypothetical protein